MKSYCVSFSLSFFLQHYVLETNSCHVKLEFVHVQCRMGFHCTRAALYILAHVAWRTWTEVSAEWLPGSRTAVSECVRLDLMRNVRVLSKVTTAASRGVSRAPGLLKAQCRLRFSFSPVEWVRMGSLGFNLSFPDD